MVEIERKRWRQREACRVAGVKPGTLRQWRLRYGFLARAADDTEERFSPLDVAVLTFMGTLTRRGFNAPEAAAWSDRLRPTLAKALSSYLKLGRWPQRPRATLEQEPVNGLAPILPVTFDLAELIEWVVGTLGLPVPSPRPTTQEARAFLAYVQTAEFRERLDLLKRELKGRSPRTWTWADVERVCGVPEWFALWSLEQPRHAARTEIENVRDAMTEVRV